MGRDSLSLSVVICTRNREQDLKELLKSILAQTFLPTEIVVVDDSDGNHTEELVNGMRKSFDGKSVSLVYVRNTRGKRLSVARNVGVDHAKGEIILFLDDDVVLDRSYIEELLEVYEKYPDAVGVQGYIVNQRCSHILNLLSKAFGLSYMEQDKWKVLSSGEEVWAFPITQIIKCERFSGSNHSFKRDVFKHSRYDEKLGLPDFGMDDLDFSYRVCKKYSGLLYTTPYARLVHKMSMTYRRSDMKEAYIYSVCGAYFFYRNIEQTFKNKMIFIRSRIGKLLFEVCWLIGALVLRRDPLSSARRIKYLTNAYIVTIRYLDRIKKGNLRFKRRYEL